MIYEANGTILGMPLLAHSPSRNQYAPTDAAQQYTFFRVIVKVRPAQSASSPDALKPRYSREERWRSAQKRSNLFGVPATSGILRFEWALQIGIESLSEFSYSSSVFPAANVLSMVTVALSLAIGWGIRGNFGHETGAMVPGALAAIAGVILSGREDWWRKVGSFAFFGALGWSFGGSISYMQVIAYTHSGHSLSVLYGFGCLFLIGFLWALFGGAGTALPAFLSRAQLRELYLLVFVIFAAWILQDFLETRFVHIDPAFRQRDPLYWYDTDWLGIAVALVATIVYCLCRRTMDFGARLVFHLCAGWWLGFAFFVLLLGWRMTPPRGDNWAGCLGMSLGLVIFLLRQRLTALLYCAVLSGIAGGVGFALADFLKLLGISSGLQTNWHSVLEQTYGFINGVGIALLFLALRRNAPISPEAPEPFLEKAGACFVLMAITYLNLEKNVETWIKAGTVAPELYAVPVKYWFNLAYVLLGGAVLALIRAARRGGPGLFGAGCLARAQLFYLAFLWWMTIGNFERALVAFAPQRLVTEGVIHLNAVLCSVLILILPTIPARSAPLRSGFSFGTLMKSGCAALALVTLLPWVTLRAVFGDHQIAYAARHIRFGPEATATRTKPTADKPHP